MNKILLSALSLSLALFSTSVLADVDSVNKLHEGLWESAKQQGKVVNQDDNTPKPENEEQESSGDSAGGAGKLHSVSNPATVEDFIIRTVGVYRDVRGEPLNLQGPGEGVIYFSADRGGTVGLGPQIVMDTASQFGFGKKTPPPKGTDRLLRVFTVDQESQSITDITVYNLGEPEEARGNLEEALGEAGLTSEEAEQVAGEIGYRGTGEESDIGESWGQGLGFETGTILRGTETVLSRPIPISGPSLVLTVNGDEFVNSNIVYNVKPIAKMIDDGRGVGLRPVIYFVAKQWLVGRHWKTGGSPVVESSICADGRGGTVCNAGSKLIGNGKEILKDTAGLIGLGQIQILARLSEEAKRRIRELEEELTDKYDNVKPESQERPSSEGAKGSDPADAGKLLYVSGTNQIQVLRDWKVVGGPNIVTQLDPMFMTAGEGQGRVVDVPNIVMQLDPMFMTTGEGQGKVVDVPNIVMQLDPMFMTAGEGQGRVVIVATENGQEAVSESVFKSALDAINNSPLEITPEGVLAAGSVVAGAALIWKYGKSMNPIGAFIAGLGIGPVAASDYCSQFRGEEGLKRFFDLDQETQLSEAKICPTLAGQVLTISEKLQ